MRSGNQLNLWLSASLTALFLDPTATCSRKHSSRLFQKGLLLKTGDWVPAGISWPWDQKPWEEKVTKGWKNSEKQSSPWWLRSYNYFPVPWTGTTEFEKEIKNSKIKNLKSCPKYSWSPIISLCHWTIFVSKSVFWMLDCSIQFILAVSWEPWKSS